MCRYVNGSDNDLEYWGLDYPPLTAYHSWLLGAMFVYHLLTQTDSQSHTHTVLMDIFNGVVLDGCRQIGMSYTCYTDFCFAVINGECIT